MVRDQDHEDGLEIEIQSQGARLLPPTELIVTDRGRPVLKIVPYRGDAREASRSLKGSVLKYDDPTAPVGVEDWESLS
jgi:hypothetical protein